MLVVFAGSASPHPESKPVCTFVTTGAGFDLNVDVCVCCAGGCDGAGAGGSGVAHASLDPQASMLFMEKLGVADVWAGLGAGAGAGVGCDKLNAE